MTFKTDKAFRNFDCSVRRELRYMRSAEQEEFLTSVISTCDTRFMRCEAGAVLWRAQLGHDWREEECERGPYRVRTAHPPSRMKPLRENATDGRANPTGIACLYLATKKETAVLEVRPLIGSYVSVGQFRVLRDLRLVNCAGDRMSIFDRWPRTSWTDDEIEKAIWSDINEAFSKPIERGDSSLGYVPTQILAEAFKLHRFDGIVYQSSYGDKEYNVALFDIEAADLISCALDRIENVLVKTVVEDDPYYIGERAVYATRTNLLQPPSSAVETES